MAIDIEAPGGAEADLAAALQQLTGQLVASVTLTPSQIKNSFTTPITLVAAPGASKIVEVLRYFAFLDYGSVAYMGSEIENQGQIGLYYGLSNVVPIDNGNAGIYTLLTGTESQQDRRPGVMGPLGTADIINEAVLFRNATGDDASGGDSPLLIELIYRIIELPT